MTREDAQALAVKFADTWRGGPKPTIWAEELETLHTSQAHHAYERLRRSEESAPSIAKFIAVYKSLEVDRDPERVDCPMCDGGGWAEAPEHLRHSPDCRRRRAREADLFATDPLEEPAAVDECHCSAVVPCSCIAGQRNRTAFTRIVGDRGSAA